MKTITIPKSFGYPTVDIVINNVKHTLLSGVEISVEDYIAEVIENAIALAPKIGRNKSKLVQRAEGSITELTANDLEGIEKIAYYAFYSCGSLTKVEIPNSVASIGEGAFYNCKLLESVEIPDGVRSIGTNAFTACKVLKSVKFGKDSRLESIGVNAFEWCDKLTSIYLPETPPTLTNVSAFANINKACIFYCKTQESLNAYKAATNWSTLTGTYTFKVESK